MRNRTFRAAATFAVGAAFLSACSGPPTKRETGALAGAALGAAAGAIIGHQTGRAAEGAAIGGALGGVGGAVAGDQIQRGDQELDRREEELARNRALIEELKRKQLDVRETRRGVVVNLPDILFEFGKSELTYDARAKVRDIADVMNQPNVRARGIAVEGHTDSIGSDDYNQRLSERRAQAVADSLAASGVPDRRMRVRGLGEKYPIAPNETSGGQDNPSGRAKNRRVEVIIEN